LWYLLSFILITSDIFNKFFGTVIVVTTPLIFDDLSKGEIMNSLHTMDLIVVGLVGVFLLLINQFVLQQVWTIEEIAYSMDNNKTGENVRFIRAIEVDQKKSSSRGGSFLITPCSINRGEGGKCLTEAARLHSPGSAVFWVY
jgi:hypothetical protein